MPIKMAVSFDFLAVMVFLALQTAGLDDGTYGCFILIVTVIVTTLFVAGRKALHETR